MKEITIPELAESITEGTIAEWLKKVGDFVNKGEVLVELETDKVNVDVSSEHSGVIKEIIAKQGDNVEVGQVIAKIDDTQAKPDGEESQLESKEVEKESGSADNTKPTSEEEQDKVEKKTEDNDEKQNNRPIASPAARKKARELGIDLNEIPYQDPLGRIRKSDVEEYKQSLNSEAENEKKQFNSLVEDSEEKIERIPMTRRRQTIAKRLVEAQQNAAMLTTFNEVDMSKIIDVRNRRKESFEKKHGVKLGFMSFFTKAVIGALKAFPYVNAEIDGTDILLKKFYDIGVAVSTDEGLVVPVVRNADKLSFAGIEEELVNLSEKARTNSLALKDLQGGTFTITNGGVFGSLYSTPILNSPQVGILGMHTIQKRPVVVDDEDNIEVRPMMYIALSYDHRIIDGKDAVQFLTTIKQLLEDPEDLLLEG
ncbi:dihydrolipoyllysine-residue succinyltransferase [Lottiidibacillus patelloidae]|uniref:Dihydrolipoyllysine-residue succinyltransferase component of 2-oxoglutarate dehydrogenase complex n=1 Tax=Lottiidibacillus patelloidae TaxID=2670334 RepID=A0A263BTW8_9BACI|nr:2-oxoglutarate dehydrogenase complex dihydrolipoyllysine-residue succinyltransferase [Lottiidibacillus patelloidae]OZM56626.1 dihydrolipoyllysine-residue succinyltransferase [Lottiidibacillus patelloidae]